MSVEMKSFLSSFHVPETMEVTSLSANRVRLVLQPLESGFGDTLGNALRRILLSSMPGAAVTEVKMKGATHANDILETIQEEVIDVLLNLKKVSVRLLTSTPATFTLSKKGPAIITAGDLAKAGTTEVANPDLVSTLGREKK